MTYIDANVFIFAILNDRSNPLAQSSISVLDKIIKGELKAVTSVLTWDEVVWSLRKNLDIEIVKEEGKKFLNFPNLEFIPADEFIIREAQKIVEKYNLKPRDAIHAATAVSKSIKEIISDDPDFDAVKEIKRIQLEKFDKWLGENIRRK